MHKYKCWVPASTAKASTDADCFVADISCNSTADLLGSGLSNGLLNIYKLQPSGLVLQNSLKEHSGVVLSVQFDPCTPHCLYSGSTDGTVLGWDLRSGKEISRYSRLALQPRLLDQKFLAVLRLTAILNQQACLQQS